MNGYLCQGFNPLMSFPNKKKITAALSKLKFLVIMDPLETETARFWENHGEFNDVDPAADPDRGVPAADAPASPRTKGSLTNSSRWLQWHWPGGDAAGRGQGRHLDHGADLHLRLKALYETEGGPFPDPILNLHWPYADPDDPTAGRDRARRSTARRSRTVLRSGRRRPRCWSRRASSSPASRSCATTARPPAAAGSIPAASTRTATTWPGATPADPDDAGVYPKWAFSWPANRRILYNRASADHRTASRGIRRRKTHRVERRRSGPATTCRTSRRRRSRTTVGPFIMNPEGVVAPVHPRHDAGRSVPGALRAVRSRRSPTRSHPKISGNPVARVFKGDMDAVRQRRTKFPYRGDHLPADRALPLLDQARPAQRRAAARVLRRDLASSWRRRRASRNGGWVKVMVATAARSRPRRW